MVTPVLQFGVPGAIELVVLLVIMFLTFVVPLVVSVLIYRDAKQRDSGHAIAWALGAFFGSLVVWILYVVVRDEVGPARTAPET
jgi:uncharacterized BrkB/YihY/UPF0761 family membrane protein